MDIQQAKSQSMFKTANRQESKVKLGLYGLSGSGKTYTSILMAKELAKGGKVAVIDSEHGSASKVAGEAQFDVLALKDNFHPQVYMDAIKNAYESGYEVIVIDSFTHAYMDAPNCLLEIVENETTRSRGNTRQAWKVATPIWNELIQTILRTPIHVILCMRGKADYGSKKTKDGNLDSTKTALHAQVREGIDYELDIYARMTGDHKLVVEKSRIKGLDGAVIASPQEELPKLIDQWLNEGVQSVTPPPTRSKVQPTHSMPEMIVNAANSAYGSDIANEKISGFLSHYGVDSLGELTQQQCDAIMAGLQERIMKMGAAA